MASPHLSVCPAHPRPTAPTAAPRRPRLIGRLGTAVLLAAAASLAVTVLPGVAKAAPDPAAAEATSPQEATELVAAANDQLEAVTEEVNDAQVQLEEQQAAAAAAGEAVAAAQAQLAALDTQIRQVARSAFTGENLGHFNALMTSGSAEEFLAQVNMLDAIAGHTDDVLAEVAAASAVAQEAKAGADAAAATAQQTLDQVTAKQADLTTRITDYRSQFAALTAAQQEEVQQSQAGPALPAPGGSSASRSVTAQAAGPVPAASEAAQVAVDTALAQLGDPYVWAAGGPNAFDCSGLTQYAYAAAGVRLPHSSAAQSRMGTAVPRSELQPGDLVFFRSPVSHVGMYIGGGRMVHAATFGVPVQVTSVDMAGYAGARRFAA
ncbi:MAG: putative Cell wall-associated hydrolase [Modestobacter sp.]|nr:putative Cell wall-associated hydrolase [Modestobacter sp.]